MSAKILLCTDNRNGAGLLGGVPPNLAEFRIANYAATSSELNELSADILLIECSGVAEHSLRILRRSKAVRPSMPVLLVSKHFDEAFILESFRAGAKDFIRYPAEAHDLPECIARCLLAMQKQSGPREPVPVRSGQVKESQGDLERMPVQLVRVICHMDKNHGRDLDLEELSRVAGISKYHFSRLFKKYLLLSPIQFLIKLRIDHAKVLLSLREETVSEIASRVGFNDLSHFNRRFKHTTGMTPSMFRKKNSSAAVGCNLS